MAARRHHDSSSAEGKKESNPFADLELRSLRDYAKIVRERWLIALVSSLLVACLVGYFQLRVPKMYEAYSTVLLQRQSERVVDMQRVVDTGLEGASWNYIALLQTQMQQIQSRSFREFVLSSFSENEIEAIIKPYRSLEADASPPSASGILGAVSSENPRDTYLIRIRFRHRDPVVAAMVADRYAEQYIRFSLDRSHSGNDLALTFLTEQSDELRARVEESDQALQAYRQLHNLVSVQENQNIIVQRLRDVSGALTAARVNRISLEDQMFQIREFQEQGKDLLEIGTILRFGSTSPMVQELVRLRKQREVMDEKYARLHPRMIENERNISATERALSDSINLAVADLSSRLASARQNEESLRGELREVERESLRLDQLTIHYQVLRRNADSARATFSQIIHRLNETAITSQLESNNIRIVDRASVPSAPFEPNVRRVVLMLLLLGGFVFVGVPVGLEFIDNKVKTSWDVEHFLGQTLVAEIPYVGKIEQINRGIIVVRDLDMAPVEAFRGLYSHLELTTEVDYPKTIVVASTLPGEGKSFVASNLAACFSIHGKNTLLVDCDFRRPVQHAMHGLDNNGGILAAFEAGETTADAKELDIREISPAFFLLRAGGHTRKATEKIKTPAMEKLFASLRERFDVIILDSSPVGIFPDALSLAALADECLYLVGYGKVNRQQVKNFIERMNETNAPVTGVVLNAVPRGKESSYGYSGNHNYRRHYEKQVS